MDFSVVLQKMLLLMLTIAIGFVANKCGAMNDDFSSKLSKFLLNITVPGALLSAGMSGDIIFSPAELGRLLLISLALFAVILVCAYAVPVIIRAEKNETGTYRFLIAFTNSIFMGYPVATAFFGKSAVIYIAILTLPFNIAVFSIGPAMLTGKREKMSRLKNVVNIGTLSAVLAMLLIVLKIRVPSVISELCSSVGSATSPIALIIIGSNLADIPLKQLFGSKRMFFFSVFRLIVIPFLVWMIFHYFISDEIILGCTVILSGLPSASMATLVSAQYGGNEKLASQGVMFSTLFSSITIPVVMYVILVLLT